MNVADRAGSAAPPSRYLGRVEGVDLEVGLFGWAYDVGDKATPVEVELWAGSTLIAVAEADRFRADLGSENDPDLNPGFVFSPGTLRFAVLNLAVDPEARLEVRVRGGEALAGVPTPTFAALNELLEEHGAPPDDTSIFDLRDALDALVLHARILRKRPLRPLADGARGFIEQVAVRNRSSVAVSGWIHRDVDLEQAAIILDGEKFEAAFSLATYERPDLPDYAHGFVGVMQTGWRPRPKGSEPFVFFGQHGEHHLRSAPGLKVQPLADLQNWIDRVPTVGAHYRVLELRQMLLSTEGWTPRSDGGSSHGVGLSIDKAILVPGFGAFIDGWTLTGPRRVGGMAIRIGSTILDLDPSTLHRRSRADLAKAYPLLKDGAANAGFVGMFMGPLHQSDLSEPMFKVQFVDGSTVTISLNAGAFQQLGANFDVDTLKSMAPSLAVEPRFPQFAAARSQLLKRNLAASAHAVLRAPAESLLILTLPPLTHELTLVLEEAARHVGRLPPGSSLALVGQENQNRDRILPWLNEIRSKAPPGVGVSFTLVENVHLALYACDALLKAHRASKFVFVGPSAWLTEEGWERVGRALVEPRLDDDVAPDYLPVAQSLFNPSARAPDAELFIWSSEAFSRWLATAPVTFDEAGQDRGLPEGPLAEGAPAAVRLRAARRSAYKAGLDRALLLNNRRSA